MLARPALTDTPAQPESLKALVNMFESFFGRNPYSNCLTYFNIFGYTVADGDHGPDPHD